MKALRALPAIALALGIAPWSVAQPPAPDVTHAVAGLTRPAEILVDTWGVPHIYAGSHYDAFFVQGFNAARDRLWQIDVWRRRGLGRLAEVFGASFVAQDRANRLFLFQGDMYREWLAYGADGKRIAEAFVAGVNAYVRLVREDRVPPPVEFTLLDYQPDFWEAADVVRIRSHGLWRNAVSEVTRARLMCQAGVERTTLWRRLEPEWEVRVPEGFDPCTVPADVLNVYLLAKAPVQFPGPVPQVPSSEEAAVGSNNWVIAPSRTAGAGAILANDPHRRHAVPSLRYAAHLVAPGLNVIGAGEPVLPGISIGHNERIAFGLTIFAIDQEDLYFYPAGEPVERRVESIGVREGPAVSAVLEFTRHGPVVYRDAERIYALRAGWLEAGMAPYLGSLAYMRAANWREFRAALNQWGGPSENQVYADVDGNIGYKPAGLFPRRTWHDGLLPVLGDGRYEWQGFFDMDALPEEYNPERGFIATANANTLPSDFPVETRRVGFEWASPWRQRRLVDVLADTDDHSVADSLALQRDYRSLLARAVVDTLPDGTFLQDWDGTMDPRSSQAAVFSVWYYRHLVPALAARLLGEQDAVTTLDTQAVPELLRDPELREVATGTLQAALDETAALLGPDPAGWRWDTLHRTEFEHPLLRLARGDLRTRMRMTSLGRGGSGHTVNNTAFDSRDFAVRAGASWRMVVDTADWDAARMTNAPGQSGDPGSPFYDNLLEGWAADESFPLLFSREAVEAHTELRIRLVPAS
ncbi:MAG: penicillin acylase family protein [Gammaproteobacteria bacterium]|nr:penicillin acylase family protein [Gammaproteobacteria bacterium]